MAFQLLGRKRVSGAATHAEAPHEGLLSQGSLYGSTSRLKYTEINSLEFSLRGGKQIMLTTYKHLYDSLVCFYYLPKKFAMLNQILED